MDSSLLGYVITQTIWHPDADPAVSVAEPGTVYLDPDEAQRDCDRTQAHADIDADLLDGRYVYAVAWLSPPVTVPSGEWVPEPSAA